MSELVKALIEFQAEMPVVPKTQRATVTMKGGGQYGYTYANLAAVAEVAVPLLCRHGLAFTAEPRATERGYELVGRLLHVSGESREAALPIGGNTPQELGSSITYMRRYLMGCMTGIVTDDDDDGKAASTVKRRTAKPKPEPEPEPEAPPREPTSTVSRDAGASNPDGPMTARTRSHLFALLHEAGIEDEDEQKRGMSRITGRVVESRSTLTEREARLCIRDVQAYIRNGRRVVE